MNVSIVLFTLQRTARAFDPCSHYLITEGGPPRLDCRPFTMTPAKLRLAQAAMAKRDTNVGDLCKELGVTRQTLYRFVGPKGELRADATSLLKRNGHQGTREAG